MDLFKLLGTIAVENAGANKAIDETTDKARGASKSVEGLSDSGTKTSGKFSQAMGKVGGAAVKVGKVVTTGLIAAGTAIGGVTAKALSAAGELEQNMGGSEAVFGEYAGKMQDKAKTAFSNMGLSASDFLGTANKMGSLFKGAGFGIEESATMSSEAMQRAADVASIMGISTESAMESIAGAAKGNFTMMDNLGVAMNDTTLQAYALEKGINKSTQEMTNQEKIGLAMEMFMERTAYAAGNYAKENSTLAGSLGTAKAALSNFLSGAGTVDDVVSSFSGAAKSIVSRIQEMFPSLMSGITQLVSQLAPMLPGLLEQLLPSLLLGATNLINQIVALLPDLISMLTTTVIPALLGGLESILSAIISALPMVISALAGALPTLLPMLLNAVISLVVLLCAELPNMIQPIIAILPTLIMSVVSALLSNLPILIEGIINLVIALVGMLPDLVMPILYMLPDIIVMVVDTLLGAAPTLFAGLGQLVMSCLDVIWGLVEALPGALENFILTLFSQMSGWVSTGWDAIRTIVNTAIEWVKSIFSRGWEYVKTLTSNLWNAIKNVISTVWDSIKSVASDNINKIKSNITTVFNALKTIVGNIWDNIKEKMTKPIEKARDTIKGIVDKIKGFFSGMKISFPNIKLPHFSVSPAGWSIGDLLKGSIPKLGIEWYAKAMNNPMLMTEPTIFGYNPKTGAVMGGGEAGSEVVSGTNTLMNMIGDVVDSRTAAQNDRIIALLTALLNAIVGGNAEMLQAMLAGHTLKIGEREFARMVKEYA